MTFTYDVSTDVGKVRLLISDTNSATQFFTDEELSTLLGLPNVSGNVLIAAAQALDVIASNEALVMKMVRILDLSTNGPAVADALRKHATQLRQDAKDAEAAEDGGAFDYAEMVVDAFTERERIWKESLRSL